MFRIGISLLVMLCLIPAALAQQPVKGPVVISAVRHDTSRPLRELMRNVKPVLDTGRQQALEMEEPVVVDVVTNIMPRAPEPWDA